MSHFRVRPLCAVVSLLFASSSGLAAAEEKNLQQVHVQGDILGEGTAEVVARHAGARQVVEREAAYEAGAASVKEAIRLIPGVQSSDNSFSGGGQTSLNIGVRGLEGRLSPRATLLLDGIPLSYAAYGQPQVSIAPVILGNLDRIDVVRGGGSVRFGPQNVGGIINFVTRDIPTKGAQVAADVRQDFYGGATPNSTGQTTSSVYAGYQGERFGLAFLGGIVNGSYHRENSREQIADFNVKARYWLTDDVELSSKLQHYEADAGLPGGLTRAQYERDRYQSQKNHDRYEGRRDAVDARLTKYFDEVGELELRAYHIDTFRSTDLANNFDSSVTRLQQNPRNYLAKGVEGRYSHRFKGESVDQLVSVGYRHVEEEGDEQRYQLSGFGTGGNPANATTRSRDRHFKNTSRADAAYIDDQIRLGKWTLTPGIRYEKIKVTSENQLNGRYGELEYSQPLPSVSLMYEWNKFLSLFANHTTSFGTIQYGQLNLSGTTSLKAEKARTNEAGFRYAKDGVRLEATVYQMRFDNQIDSVTVGGTTTYFNVGETLHRGLELAGQWEIGGGWNVFGNYANTLATIQSGDLKGNQLNFYSRHSGTVGIALARAGWKHQVGVYGQSGQYSDAAGAGNTETESADGKYGRIPGYALLNARTSTDLNSAFGKYNLALGVNNLLGRDYYTRCADTNGGILAGAPRTVYVQLSAKW